MVNSPDKNCPRKRILIVEDNKMHSELLKIIIQSSLDAGVVIAETGIEALDKIAEDSRFDLITIDIMIPKLNGLEVLKTIRKDYNEVPVLMVSALSDQKTIDTSFAEGATDYCTKPIENALLKDKINTLLKKFA